LADPQDLVSAAQLIQEHRHELEYLADLIQWRLKLRKQGQNERNADNPFYWRFVLRGSEVPADTEEHAAGFYERGEYERAEAVFRLLVNCFDRYAEGYNYLGLIALQRNDLGEAITNFQKTIELGRRLFPKRIGKKRYWSDHSTRPYMRGLRNLTLTLNQAGRYDQALALCDRLEQECGDDFTALSFRSAVHLNTGRWQMAADAAVRLHRLYASLSFTAAFALFELCQSQDAFAYFLHGALNHPRTARMLLGVKMAAPKTHNETRDHNGGVELIRELRGFLSNQKPQSRGFFEGIVRDPRVRALLDEIEAVVERWRNQHPTVEREAFDRMHTLHTPDFARQKAEELAGVIAKHNSSGTCRMAPRASHEGHDPREDQ
jgi:tetratricopeptide (TPR) repeat protein